MGSKLEDFSAKYHDVGNASLTIRHAPWRLLAVHNISCFGEGGRPAILGPLQQGGSTYVDLALNWNTLAVFAAFAFVGAILLGAF